MSKMIKVKVNLHEFTYWDKKGYHTVVGYGNVPQDNREVQIALEKRWIESTEEKAAVTQDQNDRGNQKDESSSKKRK